MCNVSLSLSLSPSTQYGRNLDDHLRRSLSQMKLGEMSSSLSVVKLRKALSFSLKVRFGLCASKDKLQNSNSKSENNKKQLKIHYLLTYLSRLHMVVLENRLVCIRVAALLPSLQLSLFGLHCFPPLAVTPFTFTFSQKHSAYPHFLIPDTEALYSTLNNCQEFPSCVKVEVFNLPQCI